MAKCPTCSTEGCYNSGFTVDCVNEECHYYSEKHANLFKQERKTDPPEAEEIDWEDPPGTEEDVEDFRMRAERAVGGMGTHRETVFQDDFYRSLTLEWGKVPVVAEAEMTSTWDETPPHYGKGNVDLDGFGACILCDAGVPIKESIVKDVEQQKEILMAALGVPRMLLETSVSRAVTAGIPNWLWEACSVESKRLAKDPGDLTKEEVVELLRG